MTKMPARERAARALCRHDGHAEDIMSEGIPMWQTYLDEVDIVLEAVLPSKKFVRLLGEDFDQPGVKGLKA